MNASPRPADSPAVRSLIEGFRGGKRVSLARTISWVENQRPGFEELLHELLAAGPQAERIGFTGPPGAGKSTLVTAVAAATRAAGAEVGVVAVDPSSPYSGGALLGDRIRMNELATDPGVFIRSMATRGSLGGLATTTREVVDVLDAFGFPRVLVETVGVGQTELEISRAADTVVVVLVPESGDGIQAMKAGLMEIADLFVVNKADRPGADRLVRELRNALHLRAGDVGRNVPAHHGVDLRRLDARSGAEPDPASGGWEIPVLSTVAQDGTGVPELLDAIARHRAWLASSGALLERRRNRSLHRIREVVAREFRRRTEAAIADPRVSEQGVDRIVAGRATPYSIAREVVRAMLVPAGGPAPDPDSPVD